MRSKPRWMLIVLAAGVLSALWAPGLAETLVDAPSTAPAPTEPQPVAPAPTEPQPVAPSKAVAGTIGAIEAQLNHAVTWYWWARATQNGREHHDRSLVAYLEARELAAGLPSPHREHWQSVIEQGIEQTEHRIDNGHDTFRTIYEPVWYLLKVDPTLDTYDEYFMRALANCWEPMVEGILTPLIAKLPAIVRCRDSFEEARGEPMCSVMREELLGHVDRTARFVSITDDVGRSLAGSGWDELIGSDELLIEPARKVAQGHRTEHLLIIDLSLADHVEEPAVGMRVDIAATLWDTVNNKVVGDSINSGLGLDLVPRRTHMGVWMVGLLLLAVGWAVYKQWAHQRKLTKKPPSQRQAFAFQAAIGLASYVLGGALGFFSRKISDDFVPEWQEVVFSPSFNADTFLALPRAELLVWPLVHGAVVIVGPAVVCAYLAMRRHLKTAAEQFGTHIELEVVIPAAQAGALAWLFAPIIQCMPEQGLGIAASLSFAALVMAVSLSRAVSNIAQPGALQVDQRQTIIAVVLGVLTLLALLPWGLFNGCHWLASLTVALLAIPVYRLSPTTDKDEPAPDASGDGARDTRQALDGMGSLARPSWLQTPDRNLDELVQWLQKDGLRFLAIQGPPGVGKTRLLEELRARFEQSTDTESAPAEQSSGQDSLPETGDGDARTIEGSGNGVSTVPYAIGAACAEPTETVDEQGDRASADPYGLASEALAPIMGLGASRFLRQQERQERAEKVAVLLGGALVGLPGVGAIFSAEEGDGATSLSRQQVIADASKAVLETAKTKKVLLLLDDLQWADTSSLELIHYLKEMLHKDASPEHPVAIVVAYRDKEPRAAERETAWNRLVGPRALAPWTNSAKAPALLKLKCLPEDQIAAFLGNSGIVRFKPSFPIDIHQLGGQQDQGNPLSMLTVLRRLDDLGRLDRVQRPGGKPGEHDLAVSLREGETLSDLVPAELKEGIWKRLEALPRDTIFILQCAALCGRTFSGSNVAAALETSRLEVLRTLAELEKNNDFLEDLDDDDLFSFRSEVVCSVLVKHLRKRSETGLLELGKAFHGLLAERMIEDDEKRQADNDKKGQGGIDSAVSIARHCLVAGPKLHPKCVAFALQAAEDAARRFAWPEALKAVAIGNQASKTHGVKAEQVDKLKLVEAKARRGMGGQEGRDESARLFLELINSPNVDRYEVVYGYLEVKYEEKEVPDLKEIVDKTDEWLAVSSLASEIVGLTCRFYRLLARSWRDKSIDRLSELTKLRGQAENLPQEPNRDRLLSYIIQEQANTLVWSDNAASRFDEIEKLFDESLQLKEQQNDKQGIAINHGMRGSFALKLGKIAQARTLFEQDLTIVLEMGDKAGEGMVLNKLADCDWKEAGQKDDKELRENALSGARKALELAVRTDREGDIVFAACAVLTYAKDIGGHDEAMNEAGGKLDNKELWDKIRSSGLKSTARKTTLAAKDHLGDQPWIRSVLEILPEPPPVDEPPPEAEPVAAPDEPAETETVAESD